MGKVLAIYIVNVVKWKLGTIRLFALFTKTITKTIPSGLNLLTKGPNLLKLNLKDNLQQNQ